MRKETILNVFPGDGDERRLILAIEQEAAASALVLRQESYSGDIGWFVQSRVVVEPSQVAGLRMALASGGSTRAVEPHSREAEPMPAILRFSKDQVAHQAG